MTTLALATLALTPLSAPPQDQFEPQVSLDGALPNVAVLKMADLDGDGLDELILVSDQYVRVSVARRESLGSFALPSVEIQPAPFGSGLATQVEIADLDGDGKLDIVVASHNTLFSALGDGQGGFGPPTSNGLSPFPGEFDLADIDSDGSLDAIIASPLAYLRGSTSGLTLGRVPILGPNASANGLAAGDFDGDGFVDLAARLLPSSGVPGGSRVLWGDGTGQYSIALSTALTVNPLSFQTEDLDGDGDLDLIAIGAGTTRINLIPNLGGRLFGNALVFATTTPNSVEVADLDFDGLPEVILRSLFFSFQTRVIQNLGAFQFGPVTSAGGSPASAGVVTDLNGDGIMDSIHVSSTVNPDSPSRAIALTGSRAPSGDIQFDPVGPIDEQFGSQFEVVPVDANRDGIDDFVVWDAAQQVALKLGLGGGEYEARQELITLGPSLTAPAVGDFNGDGIDDLVTYPLNSGSLVLAAGDGVGGFGAASSLASLGANALSLRARDLDLDGFDDLVWIGGQSVRYAFGGPQGLSVPAIVPSPSGTAIYLRQDDLNGDGLVDLLVSAGDGLDVAFQQPGQTFGPLVDVVTGVGTVAMATVAIDVDRDGVKDIAYAAGLSSLSWLRSLGGGTFAAPQILLPVNGLARIEAVDLTGDGAEDLVWSHFLSGAANGLSWSENLAGAAMSDRRYVEDVVPLLKFSHLVAVLDADGDGDQDLLTRLPGTVPTLAVAANTLFGSLGEGICSPIVANSTGREGQLTVTGSVDLSFNQLGLNASDLPVGAFGFFITSRQSAVVQNIPGSVGTLCLAGPIGRFSAPNQIRQADASGSFQLDVDVTQIPSPMLGLIPIVPGDTWVFQAWHRDAVGGSAVSNFTQAVRVTF